MKPDKDIPVTRAIGRFFGHIFHSATKPVEPDTESTVVSQKTEEQDAELNGQKVVLRRTTIEEVEVKNDE